VPSGPGSTARNAGDPHDAEQADAEQLWSEFERVSGLLSVMDIRAVRLPEELADEAGAVARVKGTSVNALIIESLAAEIERLHSDDDYTTRARMLLDRDREIIDRPAK